MLVYILCFLVGLLYIQHVFTIVLFLLWIPNAQFQKNRSSILYKILAFPCRALERFCFRYGGERYLIYQIGLIPSLHLRKWAYRWLGVKMGDNVIFHFGTEIRNPRCLSVGGGYHYWRRCDT